MIDHDEAGPETVPSSVSPFLGSFCLQQHQCPQRVVSSYLDSSIYRKRTAFFLPQQQRHRHEHGHPLQHLQPSPPYPKHDRRTSTCSASATEPCFYRCYYRSELSSSASSSDEHCDDDVDRDGLVQRQRHGHPDESALMSGSNDNDSLSLAFQQTSLQFRGLSTNEIQRRLVQLGIDFDKNDMTFSSLSSESSSWSSKISSHPQIIPPKTKVPGCVATVYLQTVLTWSSVGTTSNATKDIGEEDSTRMKHFYYDYKVSLRGTADALLSRGLLAVLAQTIENWMSLSSSSSSSSKPNNNLLPLLLELDGETVADRLGLRSSLSRGRNDGLASMVRTIQSQLQSMLLLLQSETPATTTTMTTLGEKIDTSTTAAGINGAPTATLPPNSATSSPSSFVASNNGMRINNRNNDSPSRQRQQPTVALLLSGGVDSSVALQLLIQQGYAVTAFYLKIWLEDELAHLGVCPWEDDYRMCQQVVHQTNNRMMTAGGGNNGSSCVDVKLETISLQQEYKERVIRYTIQEAEQGRTPNPDILCNSRIKFGCFYDAIASRGDFDYVASGHYAQVVRDADSTATRLLRAPDPVKDQSYFLCALKQEQLSRVLFPIGHLCKSQVRVVAEDLQLPNRHRPDSQGLCFLGKVKFEEFLRSYLGERPGPILDAATGERLGEHRGLWYHTVGQRKGIGKVLNPRATSRGPWYVVAKDPERNIIFCSNAYDESLFASARSQISVENIRWIAGDEPPSTVVPRDGRSVRLIMKVRHGPKLVSGTLTLTDPNDCATGNVQLDNKDSGLAPGQYVAFYDGEECLGGGVISERHWTKFLLDCSVPLIRKNESSEVLS